MSLVGKKVKVTFNTDTWPVSHGTYTYEGHDEVGHWLRRSDGVQRHIHYIDVVGIEELNEQGAEGAGAEQGAAEGGAAAGDEPADRLRGGA